jgi:hypothetical protein
VPNARGSGVCHSRRQWTWVAEMDVVAILIAVAFFALMWLLVEGLDRL